MFLELDQNRSILSYEYSSFSDKEPTVVQLSSKFKSRISTELLISLIRLSFLAQFAYDCLATNLNNINMFQYFLAHFIIIIIINWQRKEIAITKYYIYMLK